MDKCLAYYLVPFNVDTSHPQNHDIRPLRHLSPTSSLYGIELIYPAESQYAT